MQEHGGHVPEDKVQYLVKTPYGRGLVVRSRIDPHLDGTIKSRELELLDWKNLPSENDTNSASAARLVRSGPVRPATLFSSADFPSIDPEEQNDVETPYGRGRVTAMRPETNQVVVRISSWRLAGRSTVTCHLNKNVVNVVRSKQIYEMSTIEKIEYAQELKQEANRLFSGKRYQDALQFYAKAVDAVRYVQHKADSTNEMRADLLVVMVTCSNNAATSCTKLHQWDEAEKFARNALVLMDALEDKHGKRIHGILLKDGFPDIKLFGEWRVKSCIVIARALAEKSSTEDAIASLKKAHSFIEKYTGEENIKNTSLQSSIKQLQSLEREIKKLHKACLERRKVERKMERKRAQAMFGAKNATPKEDEKKDGNFSNNPSKLPKLSAPGLEDGNPVTKHSAKTCSPSIRSVRSDVSEKSTQSLRGDLKRRVSFATKIDDRDDDKDAASDVLEWYQDSEVLIGLAIFAGMALTTFVGLNYFLFSPKR
ncbi:predicted protein [Phaeodactylum tricornutum CCAP 1055/1]|jgi:hypothetical protein|uniref:Uncharacterized protein n=1 Tax=Phaeodactylum tricornutum (strain CCAP 1055/1) TaxID=556484 RepID=B5Y5W3_PHATC|nr:predicted protein [Phaeodactylum tricornutum CCAP 1055/1]ACI65729.1 predicted protein [Phaeodactylum tricornutum CCAP 1055/1]|eukprot:XP_002186259.1 predicted protein [Phaeodactylum tricornutum CCAP 1055/1]